MTRLHQVGLADLQQVALAAVAVCIVVLAVIATAAVVRRRIARLLGEMVAQVRRVGVGDYSPAPPLPRDDEIGKLSLALSDMTEALAEREQRIQRLATREPITNRPNRASFLDTIAPWQDGQRGAILVVGLVRANEVANTVGRDVADCVLRDVSQRLGGLLREAPVACLDNRSFATFLRDAGEPRARSVASAVIELCDEPYSDGEMTIDTGVAVGIALKPLNGTDGAELLHRAQVALTAALHSESHWAIYDPAADPYRPERLSLMSDLRRGLLANEFSLLFQPKLHIPTGAITGAEALVRWHHPRRGLVPPDGFIGLAEETGNIRHLTRWALRAGVAQAARWRDAGLCLRIAINLSVRDLTDARLPAEVTRLLAEHDLDSRAISLEVTESAVMADPDAAMAVLRGLAAQGFWIAVDDFGIGQTSLTYLRRMPVRELKIDKSFVLHLANDAEDRKIVRSVIELGHGLGFAVTAEGVEDEASLDALANLGCDYAQGFQISRPVVGAMMLGVRTQFREPLAVPAANLPR
ncbi:MAG TPA: EAL domain-containing protein [Acetobacteraceae bacterium]|nr:EAL domain-containing protein [Acetobacteraceae bacterium]